MTRQLFIIWTVFLSASVGFFSCKGTCRKITTRVYCNNCSKQTIIKTYLNCSDTSSYTDSTFEEKHLWRVGEIKNNKENGTWIWFDTSGRIGETIIYDNGIVKKRCDYKIDGLDYCTTFDYQNDTVVYLKRFNSKGVIFEEGLLQNDNKYGQWKLFDTITGERILANYFPKIFEDSKTLRDTSTGEVIFITIPMNGILNGQWIKYDRNGKVIENKIFEMGKEIKAIKK